MELFKITCVTCRAGLSVRNESIIGQIIACPQCGSMVQVVSPGEPGAPPAEAGSPGLLVETTVPAPISEEPITPDLQTAAAVTNYTLIAWAVAVILKGFV